MSVKCRAVIEAMDQLAPPYLAEGWDNVGLLVGSPGQDVASILIAVDVTPEVANWAVEDRVDMIVAHHPLVFKPLRSIRTDSPPGGTLATLLKAGIVLFVAHTNLDAVSGGVSDILADKLGLVDCRPLETSPGETLLKLVVFTPETMLKRYGRR